MWRYTAELAISSHMRISPYPASPLRTIPKYLRRLRYSLHPRCVQNDCENRRLSEYACVVRDRIHLPSPLSSSMKLFTMKVRGKIFPIHRLLVSPVEAVESWSSHASSIAPDGLLSDETRATKLRPAAENVGNRAKGRQFSSPILPESQSSRILLASQRMSQLLLPKFRENRD